VKDLERFQRAAHTRGRGVLGEADAVRWLAGQGYEIVRRNVSTDVGEIDVVARDGKTPCFIEVKARSTDCYGPAIAAVDRRKQRRLARTAMLYLVDNPWDGPCRFDVLGLGPGSEGWETTLNHPPRVTRDCGFPFLDSQQRQPICSFSASGNSSMVEHNLAKVGVRGFKFRFPLHPSCTPQGDVAKW
jgi:putative endonuclease